MTTTPVFTDKLPEVNHTQQFVILESAKKDFVSDWLGFANHILEIAYDESSDLFRTIKTSTAQKKRQSLFRMPSRAKDYLGIGNFYTVVDIDFNENNEVTTVQKLSYADLITDYYTKERDVNKALFSIRNMLDLFFAYQWGRGKLLYPLIGHDTPGRFENWFESTAKNSTLIREIQDWFIQSRSNGSTTIRTRRSLLVRVLVSTTWYDYKQIDEDKIKMIDKLLYENIFERYEYYKEINLQTLTTNELRNMLMSKGIKNITTPGEIAHNRRLEKLGIKKSIYERFDWVDTKRYPQLEKTRLLIIDFIKTSENNGSAKSTITGMVTMFNRLLNFLIDKTSANEELSVSLVDEFFEPGGKRNLLNYLIEEKELGKHNAVGYLHKMIQLFVFGEFYSAKARKYTPRIKAARSLTPHRMAMPKEMVSHIIDILTNRPPAAPTVWNRQKADTSWWKFDTYPVHPIMMLIHYCIPLRGEQIRWLSREDSFVFDESGERITTFVVSTDKNVNRKELQEIPNVWNVLDILVPFLKWHKEFFPVLEKVTYHNDPNSPWGDILPVMNLPGSYKPISNTSHMDYHKRVLCQYQIEVAEAAHKEGRNDYPIVAKFKDGSPFFKSVEELNNANTTVLKEIEVAYDIHSIRVTGATRYLEAGVGIRAVMDLTGHKSMDMLLRIYIYLTREEKEKSLRSAANKIFFGDKETIVENTRTFLSDEMSGAFAMGNEKMRDAMNDNGLFSLYRKASSSEKVSVELEIGTDIAIKTHPSLWRPMIHGLCPGVKCPEGRENKCSLCPYLITGRLFSEGIVHKINTLFAAFQRESIWFQEDRDRANYNNHAKAEELETMVEEIIGWQEIMEKINEDIASANDNTAGKHLVKGDATETRARKALVAKAVPTEIAYLNNAYDANLMGVEQDRYGMKLLTLKAVKIAAEMGDMDAVKSIGENESDAIDLLMQYYTDSIEQKEEVQKFISAVTIASPRTKEE